MCPFFSSRKNSTIIDENQRESTKIDENRRAVGMLNEPLCVTKKNEGNSTGWGEKGRRPATAATAITPESWNVKVMAKKQNKNGGESWDRDVYCVVTRGMVLVAAPEARVGREGGREEVGWSGVGR